MWQLSDASLTETQLAAVQHIDGPLLILAGPGSGKTRVVTHRIAHLQQEGVPPSQIVALTFTNKAADEMRSRVEQLAPSGQVWMSTFHRFCSRLLRQYAPQVGLTENFTIYDTDDSLRALRHVMQTANYDTGTFSPKQIADEISRAKNNLIEGSTYAPRAGVPLSSVVSELYPAYQKQLLNSAAVDFDDLLLHVAVLLRDSPEIRQTLDARLRYILIDEYQDTNRAQYEIVKALAQDYRNLAVTGDPDQSIFGWRGANLSNILEFEHDFPDVRVIRLEQNYRSTKRILRVADALIGHNVRRKEKNLYTQNEAGTPVRLVFYPTHRVEAETIAARIAADLRAGRHRAGDFAIFYRVNALSRELEHAMREQGVAYQLVKGLEFYQRKEIKDVIAYLQLINNPRDDVALLRVINTPPRGIGKKTIERLSEYAARRALTMLEAARQAGMIEGMSKRAATLSVKFAALIDRLSVSAADSIEQIVGLVLSLSGYHEHLRNSEAAEDEDRLANIEELLTVARQFDEHHPEAGSLEKFLEETALVNDTDEWSERSERVTLMTLHSAKGLEFPVVYIIAAEQGLLPHERSRENDAEVEEERRLFFVGITRAQQELQISTATFRDFRGVRKMTVPSEFLLELPRDEMELIQPDHHVVVDEWEVAEPAPATYAPVRETVDESPLQLTTAAQLAAESLGVGSLPESPSYEPDPESFRVGMAVTHPKHGLGKIAALSGNGAKRTATVNFAVAGQRNFRLKESALRPAGVTS